MPRNFKPNSDGFKQIAVSREVRSALAEVVEKAKGIAEGLSQDFRITGEYAGAFGTGEATIMWAGEYPGPRAIGILQNLAPYSVDVEYGHGNRHDAPAAEGHRVFGRTLDALDTE